MTKTLTSRSRCDLRVASQRYWIGGAVIGSKRFCYSLAEMEITPDELVLRLADFTRYAFKPWQISEIEVCPCGSPGVIPAAGLKICHRVDAYPEQIVFQLLCYSPEPFLDRLQALNLGKN